MIVGRSYIVESVGGGRVCLRETDTGFLSEISAEHVPSDIAAGEELFHDAGADLRAPWRRISAFHRDAEGQWVAELSCGHGRHMRHNPPFQVRAWTQDPEARARMVGVNIPCQKCLSGVPLPDPAAIATPEEAG